MCDQQNLRSAYAYAQSLKYSMSIKLLTEHYLEFLGLKGGYTGSSESTLFKMPHCWKSRVTAQHRVRHINIVLNVRILYVRPCYRVVRSLLQLSEMTLTVIFGLLAG